jgi:hypothetical protein
MAVKGNVDELMERLENLFKPEVQAVGTIIPRASRRIKDRVMCNASGFPL